MILSDVRVADLSGGIAGAYLSRLFADGGADVIRVESEAGVDLRRRSTAPVAEGTNGPLFSFLAAGTRSVVGALGDTATEELLASADLIVVDDTLTPADVSGIQQRNRFAVITSIRPYGLEGPWAERSLNEFLVQADTGSISCRGHVSLPPYAAGGDVFEWMAACYAAPPSLAAIDRSRRCGLEARWSMCRLLSRRPWQRPLSRTCPSRCQVEPNSRRVQLKPPQLNVRRTDGLASIPTHVSSFRTSA